MKKHLDFIRSLPCTVCAENISVEAAHVRYADGRSAKPITGIGIKPGDEWTVPLCGNHHREQHNGSERAFWRGKGIDPIFVALALHHVSGDHQAGLQIIRAIKPELETLMGGDQ